MALSTACTLTTPRGGRGRDGLGEQRVALGGRHRERVPSHLRLVPAAGRRAGRERGTGADTHARPRDRNGALRDPGGYRVVGQRRGGEAPGAVDKRPHADADRPFEPLVGAPAELVVQPQFGGLDQARVAVLDAAVEHGHRPGEQRGRD
nr:hypothetical protein [Trebonia kvetii]